MLKPFLLLVGAIALQAPLSQQTGSVQGIVVRAGSSEPVGKATVEILGGGVPLQSTTTEPDGRFFFRNLLPGAYQVNVWRDGFAPAEYGQRWIGGPGVPIRLSSGQQVSAVQIPLTATASISGRVSDSNGQPLANAQVQALKSRFHGELRVLLPVQQVRTTATGDFRLYWLPAGRYYVNVIVPGGTGNSQILVNSSGRTDPAALYSTSSQPRSVLGQSAITGAPAPGAGGPNTIDSGPVYFPSTPYIQSAAPIDLRPGAEFKGLNLQMTPVRKYTVCGVVRNLPPPPQRQAGTRGAPPPPPPPRPTAAAQPVTSDPCGMGNTNPGQGSAGAVQLVPLDVELRAALNASGNRYNANVDAATGQFAIRNVLPGRYDLSTFINSMVAGTTVDVRDRDVENATLILQGGSPLPTRITVDGQAPEVQAALQGLIVVIGSDPPYQGRSPSNTSPASGDFIIQNVSPRDRRVYVVPILNPVVTVSPPTVPDALKNAYVKSASLGGVEVLNTGFQFNGEPDKTLEIVLGVNAGTLAGRVEDERRQPAAGVLVALVPDARSARLFRTDMNRMTSTDAEGRFEVKGLPPGDYKVFALDGFDKEAWLDPDFFKPHEDRGVTVRVDEGKTQNLPAPLGPIRP
jgi:hypothetical protein